MVNILNEIIAERKRQDAKWGEQNHPVLDQTLLTRTGGCSPERMCEEYEIPSENRAKNLCEANFLRGSGTWMHAIVEELSEATSCLDNTNTLRKELIQVAAIVVATIESLDRNGK